MAIRKLPSGKWEVNVKPGGRTGRQIRRVFKFQTDARQFEQWVLGQAHSQPDWKPEKPDQRRMSELIEIWWEAHGKQLSAADDTHRRLKAICEGLKNPTAANITASAFASYRTRRITDGLTPATANRELAYVRAVFNTLKGLGEWKKPNPVENVKAFRVQESELAWLTLPEIETLLSECGQSRNPHVHLIATICLSTGARWSEGEDLKISQVKPDHLHLHHTKSKKVRNVPISTDLYDRIRVHHDKHGDGQRVFQYAWGAFREAVERTAIELPDGQMTHVLRHTFASHFMQNGGNILALQRLLGHSDLKTTMRYAHLAPGHLGDAMVLNPIALLASNHSGGNANQPPSNNHPTTSSKNGVSNE